MRIDPDNPRSMFPDQISSLGLHSLTMVEPVAQIKLGFGSSKYVILSTAAAYKDSNGDWWPSIKNLPGPSNYIILMDGGGSKACGKLHDLVRSEERRVGKECRSR